MLGIFSLASVTDWPGFTCLPTLFIVTLLLKRPKKIVKNLAVGSSWSVLLFLLMFYYLATFSSGPADLLSAAVKRSGTGGQSLSKVPLYWGMRGVIYLLPTTLIFMSTAIITKTLRTFSKGASSVTPPEVAMLAFALASTSIFFLLKEWTVVIAITIMYWVPVASFWSAHLVYRWIIGKEEGKPGMPWRPVALLASHFVLATSVIIALALKESFVASDAEVGRWLKTQLRGEGPLSIYVNHHGGDTNPVAFRYWTRREVHAVLESEIKGGEPFLFVPPALAMRLEARFALEKVGEYKRLGNMKGKSGQLLVQLYSSIFPEREKFLSAQSPYEGWILLRSRGPLF